METIKGKFNLDEYSASQTTLEQIFNTFARTGDFKVEERSFTKESLKNGNILLANDNSQVVSFDGGEICKILLIFLLNYLPKN